MEKIEKLTQQKLQKQVSFLKAELEETFALFQEATKTFVEEFGPTKPDMTTPEKYVESVKMLPVFDIPKKETLVIFKKISQKIHPDKLDSKKLPDSLKQSFEKQYTLARESVDNRDWFTLVDIANSLDINITYTLNNLTSTIDGLSNRINELKTTLAWKWHFSDKTEDIRKRVEKQLEQVNTPL